jgi:hypothetical protein
VVRAVPPPAVAQRCPGSIAPPHTPAVPFAPPTPDVRFPWPWGRREGEGGSAAEAGGDAQAPSDPGASTTSSFVARLDERLDGSTARAVRAAIVRMRYHMRDY